ncbi:MAG: pseudouridine synthase [Eubacterium sp.]|nr:pseudouridine synthase [Eubacterium sp.]
MEIRINKYLAVAGVCSRREADRLVEDGRVTINGKVAENGCKVIDGDIVCLDGKQVAEKQKIVIAAYHKPVGVICTTSEKERPNLSDVIDFPERLFPIGRLDKSSSGLLLLTNDGELADKLMRGRYDHEKEYIVKTDKPLTDSIVDAMEQGVPILDTMTKPCKISERDGNIFHITLTQGLNRQIRRMCEYFGYRVTSLHRIRFATISLGNMKDGDFRLLTDEETKSLYDEIS